jgi:hypothetical protein
VSGWNGWNAILFYSVLFGRAACMSILFTLLHFTPRHATVASTFLRRVTAPIHHPSIYECMQYDPLLPLCACVTLHLSTSRTECRMEMEMECERTSHSHWLTRPLPSLPSLTHSPHSLTPLTHPLTRPPTLPFSRLFILLLSRQWWCQQIYVYFLKFN